MERRSRKELWRRVRGVIREYPRLSAAADAGTLAPERRAEYEAVRDALDRAGRLPDGAWRSRLVRLTLTERSRTMDGAALECHVSRQTAFRWNGEFIAAVAKNLGWI